MDWTRIGYAGWSLMAVALLVLLACGTRDSSTGSTVSRDGGTQTGNSETETTETDDTADGDETPDGAQGAATATEPNGGVTAETSSGYGAATNDEPTYREELFVDWPAPQAALFITGRQHGYIEPCGCTGLANQRGGLARRYSLLQQLKERGWPVIALDGGNQVRRFGRQAEIKFQSTAQGLQQMDYQVVGLGPDDLRLPITMLLSLASEDDGVPFVCCNAAFFGEESLTPHHKVVEINGVRIGVTAVIGPGNRNLVNNAEVEFSEARDGLTKAWQALEAANCDYYVLLAQASMDESREFARQFPNFNLVVTSGGAGEPTREPEKIAGTKVQMIQHGTKGMYVGVIGLFDDAENPVRYQRVPLDSRFPDPRPMLDLMKSYQETLQQMGLEGLQVTTRPHPSGAKFVGSEACADCHDAEYEIWKSGLDGKGGPHHHATESLVNPGERSEIARHFDPECLSCHVTGWNPQQYYPYESGYLELEKSKLLHGSGCENCHGPGSQHVAFENGDLEVNEDVGAAFRDQMRLTLDAAEQKCMTCHDLDNSPDFHIKGAFERFWKRVEH